jgi:hypothetical protein
MLLICWEKKLPEYEMQILFYRPTNKVIYKYSSTELNIRTQYEIKINTKP